MTQRSENIRLSLERVVMNVNKSLYKWNKNALDNDRVRFISQGELKQLFNQCFLNILTPYYTKQGIKRFLRHNMIWIDVDAKYWQISKMRFIEFDDELPNFSEIKKILEQLSYESLTYREEMENDISFDSIRNITF